MSDIELINKAAHRIYPTHLTEHEKSSSFSWSGVLPVDAKLRLGDSEGHKQTDDRNSHTLTHKLKGGASIEFNIMKNGKNHIAMAKYHKGGKLFTAIHSHEDPSKAIKTAYDSVARRIVTEEAEVVLIEKMEKRIEKKTGKLSDKKEKIDVEPSEEKELKESQELKIGDHVQVNHRKGQFKGKVSKPMSNDKMCEVTPDKEYHTEFDSKPIRVHSGLLTKLNESLDESTPPGMESWVKKNKARFVKEYGEKKGHEVLYATAWKLHNKMNEMEELNELSKKTLASYIKHASHHARNNDFQAGRQAVLGTQRGNDFSDFEKHVAVSAKRQKGIEKAADKLAEAEYPTDTKQGILAQLDYHHGRENYHRQSAEMNHRKANKFTLGSENYKLYKNVAKGQEAIANHHHNSIQDLHKKFAMVNEAEQLDELSPHTLGMYTKIASIDMAGHRAQGALSHRAQIDADSRGSEESAKAHEGDKIQHDKKATKRLNGIIKATDKLVRKAVVKEEQIEEARSSPHPDKVVMTSSIRKDLGGGYMAKTKNGHYYKLDVKALGEPGKGRELPKIGSVLDTSKHKFIGKDKVDLGMLKEELDHNHPDMKAYHAACKARDEAHLASIRYRMNHDIKQPEHRAKYDELEAEHHRLRDIEDEAAEKVYGRLFAHHALKK